MKSQENISKQPKKYSDTWAMRGIEPETRTAVTIAARKAGQTVGEWCNKALREAATERLKERNQAVGPTIEETLAKLAESMNRQAEATQQHNATMTARMEALERGKGQDGLDSKGNLFMRLYGLLRRPAAGSVATTERN